MDLRKENVKCDCSTVADPDPVNDRLYNSNIDYCNHDYTAHSMLYD